LLAASAESLICSLPAKAANNITVSSTVIRAALVPRPDFDTIPASRRYLMELTTEIKVIPKI
jgi:hypothetical protein